MSESFGGLLGNLRRSWGAGIAALVGLGLLLQIPVSMIGGLVTERESRSVEAIADISSKWGSHQIVSGPVLAVPYIVKVSNPLPDGSVVAGTARRVAIFLPEQLEVSGDIKAETRNRGIFAVPVYRLRSNISGHFATPNFGLLGEQPLEILWNQAQLALGISDVRAVQGQLEVAWNSNSFAFEPGLADFQLSGSSAVPIAPSETASEPARPSLGSGRGIHAKIPVDPAAGSLSFSLPVEVNGTGSLRFMPFGKTTAVRLKANSPNPSFQGAWLPRERHIDDKGFEAMWSIPYLGRGYPQAWEASQVPSELLADSAFGVTLIEPVDRYRMAERSVKYASLFVVLTFAAVWLIEVVSNRRIHWIQYLMVGAALCMFFLLELSLAEHIGFSVAYLVATAAVVALVAGYGKSVFGGWKPAALVGVGVAILYGYLYLLLLNEDYSLLGGSLGLFAMLAAAMYATRGVDWYGVAGKDPSQ